MLLLLLLLLRLLLPSPDIVAINQDSAGLPPRLVWQRPPMSADTTSPQIRSQALARPLSRGRIALLQLNRGPAPANLSTTWAQIGIKHANMTMGVYDVISRRQAGSATGFFAARVPSHDVSFVVLDPAAPG